ncbi:MAG: protein translocase subunit SecDF [Bacteroidota bacterium]
MKNKNITIWLTIVISILCIFFLTYTWKANSINDEATKFGTVNGKLVPAKRQAYIDSLWKENVFLGSTTEEVFRRQLQKGLDLQGGLHVILEVSPTEVIKSLSGNTTDPKFRQALANAQAAQATSNVSINQLFYNEYAKLGGKSLATIFANSTNRGKINYQSSDAEVKRMIDTEVEEAIDRSYKIIMSRVDKFGVANPVIQRIPGSGRIQVELPGIDNPERVKKLLTGAAKLEFCEVYEIQTYSAGLDQLGAYLTTKDLEEKIASKKVGTEAKADTSKGANSLESALAGKGKSSADSVQADSTSQVGLAKLFFPIGNGDLGVYVKDTAKVNELFRRPEVKTMFPNDLSFVYDVKAKAEAKGNKDFVEMYAVKRLPGGRAALDGDVMSDARQDFDDLRQVEVTMTMNPEGARKWKNITAANIGKRIAILLDNNVYSAPVVNGEIPNGRSNISGNFTVEEGQDLANVLKAGKLPAPTRIVEEAYVGPSLGKEAINQGYMSMLLGLGLVILFMILYYGNPGWVANVALLFNVFFIIGVLVQITAVLTLPGIAGIVLTLGMAVDANVLINERIKEEIKAGKGLLDAINLGYEKALSAIIDGNVTTILIGVILIIFSSGSVKGFGVTLCIGLITSVFTSVFISHVIMEWLAKRVIAAGNEKKMTFETFISKGLFANLNFDYIGKRKYSYWISWTLIALGFIAIFAKGGFNLGVDFKGGRSYVVQFNSPVESASVREVLSSNFKNNSLEVKTFDTDDKLKITTSYLVEDESIEASTVVKDALSAGLSNFSAKAPRIISESKVGATIADDILRTSFVSIFYSLVAIFLYVWLRFRKWQYSLGGVIALLHDALIVLGMVGICRVFGWALEVDQVFIAAVLTVIGYSINDTVVVFDRIREYLGPNPDLSNRPLMIETINRSINQTMSRTIMTATTVFLVVSVLLIFGGDVLRGFSFAMFVGCLIGTYSSIFVAAPIVVDFIKKKDVAVVAAVESSATKSGKKK